MCNCQLMCTLFIKHYETEWKAARMYVVQLCSTISVTFTVQLILYKRCSCFLCLRDNCQSSIGKWHLSFYSIKKKLKHKLISVKCWTRVLWWQSEQVCVGAYMRLGAYACSWEHETGNICEGFITHWKLPHWLSIIDLCACGISLVLNGIST